MTKRSEDRNNHDFWLHARTFLHEYLPKVRNLSPNTIASYKQSMTCYIDYLTSELGIERRDITFESLSRKNIKAYLVWMSEKKMFAIKTCNLRMTALKSFLQYSADEDITLVSNYRELCSVRGIKEHKNSISYMSNDAIQALLKIPKTDTIKGRRNRMMFILLYNTAARAQELVDLTVRDLHLVNVKSTFVTLTGKGNKSRNVPLMARTVDHLNQYLKEFHRDATPASGTPLFYSVRDGKEHALSTDSVNMLLGEYARQARLQCPQIPAHVHCHLIRKTRAMNLYQQGMPLTIIMEMLGHENLSTTTSFYAFATVDMIQEAMKKANPEAMAESPTWKTADFKQMLYTLD